MGVCSRIAVQLDYKMLVKRVKIKPLSSDSAAVAPQGLANADYEVKTGAQVAEELCGRPLLRYLLRKQVGRFRAGSAEETYVTPTPFSPEEAVSWLALPQPNHGSARRTHVLLIDPAKLPPAYRIIGPRWVQLGGGIEYVLLDGFPGSALVNVGTESDTHWELEVR